MERDIRRLAATVALIALITGTAACQEVAAAQTAEMPSKAKFDLGPRVTKSLGGGVYEIEGVRFTFNLAL